MTAANRDYRRSREQLMRLPKRELVAEVEQYRLAVQSMTRMLHESILSHDATIKQNCGPAYIAELRWDQATAMVSALFFISGDEHQAIWDRALEYVRSGQYAADEAEKEANYARVRAEIAARRAANDSAERGAA